MDGGEEGLRCVCGQGWRATLWCKPCLNTRLEVDRQLWVLAPRTLCSDQSPIPITSRDAQVRLALTFAVPQAIPVSLASEGPSLQGFGRSGITKPALGKQQAGPSFLWDIWPAELHFWDPAADAELQLYCEPHSQITRSGSQIGVLVVMPCVPREGSTGKDPQEMVPREGLPGKSEAHNSSV